MPTDQKLNARIANLAEHVDQAFTALSEATRTVRDLLAMSREFSAARLKKRFPKAAHKQALESALREFSFRTRVHSTLAAQLDRVLSDDNKGAVVHLLKLCPAPSA